MTPRFVARVAPLPACDFDEHSQGSVDRVRVVKHRLHLRLEKHDVRPLTLPLVIDHGSVSPRSQKGDGDHECPIWMKYQILPGPNFENDAS